jgi:hypothetical protein
MSRRYTQGLKAEEAIEAHRNGASPVEGLGLSYFNINQQSFGRLNYGAEIVWVEVEKDEQGFLSFIDKVLDVIELPEAPGCSPSCQWSGYTAKLNSAQ